MKGSECASRLGIRSPYVVIHGQHPDQATQSGYCLFDQTNNRFSLFIPEDDNSFELHELGHIRSHELGFPILARTVRHEESFDESKVFDSTNISLQNYFQHPHVYSIIAPFMDHQDWTREFEETLSKFEFGTGYYGSEDFEEKTLPAFAVASMAIQLTEVMLSAKRHSQYHAERAKNCMRKIDGLAEMGLCLRDGFWERAISTLEPYYDKMQDEYAASLNQDFQEMAKMILPEGFEIKIYTGPTMLTAGIISPIPGIEIPNWLVDYFPK